MICPNIARTTLPERFRFAADADQLGVRVAEWLLSEARGWSALDDLLYWGGVRKQACSIKEPERWAS